MKTILCQTIRGIIVISLLCGIIVPATGTIQDEGPLTARFTVDRVYGAAPLTVQFTDTSNGTSDSWYWEFGDGNISKRQHPAYTYQDNGNFTVTLTVRQQDQTSQYTLPVPITVRTRAIIPEPDFTFNISSGLSPLAVRFTDMSDGSPTSWSWDFDNDGTIDSTEQDPVCVYQEPGNYTVTLEAGNSFRTRKITLTEIIAVRQPGPGVMFAANNTTGYPPMSVRFKDLSSGTPTAWSWDFDNDGTIDSTEQDPVCVYKIPGNYSVSLRATNSSGSTTRVEERMIIAASPEPVAGFTANRTLGGRPFTVRFNDTSTGPDITRWAWDFDNDGIIDSTEQDPVCIYNLTGDYTVNLTVGNAQEYGTRSRERFITVTNGVSPDFTANQTFGTAPLAIRFTDLSVGPGITSRAWDFNNDSVIDSTEQDPVCVYRIPGNYTVNLMVANADGAEAVSGIGFITVTNALTPDFTANQTSGIGPLAVRFTDNSTGSGITRWAWDFNNDGTIDSTEQDPVCVYNQPGEYTVNLTLGAATGPAWIKKPEFITVTTGIPRARFGVNRTTGIAPLAVQFKDVSVGENITSLTWDFDSDGTIDSTDTIPLCIYTLPGKYTITMTATNSHGTNSTLMKDFITVES
ncbi:MAG: PKD domain-containing protein [Methanoregula sp.]|jgi:PKD repeat protein|nr:PKD domain-containing protein [Methanoregula sp.]